MRNKAIILVVCLCCLLAAAPVLAGEMVAGRCSACGFQTGNLPLFGGRANFQTVCNFPVLCQDCGKLEVHNLLGPRQACQSCPTSAAIPYDDPRLQRVPGTRTVASWNARGVGRALVLNDGGYYCPACGRYELRFQRTAMYD